MSTTEPLNRTAVEAAVRRIAYTIADKVPYTLRGEDLILVNRAALRALDNQDELAKVIAERDALRTELLQLLVDCAREVADVMIVGDKVTPSRHILRIVRGLNAERDALQIKSRLLDQLARYAVTEIGEHMEDCTCDFHMTLYEYNKITAKGGGE